MAANNFPAQVRQSKSVPQVLPRNLRRAVCAEYMRDFDIGRVAEMFDTSPTVIRRIVNSNDMQKHVKSSLGDTSQLDAFAARRLLEALLEEAFGKEESKGRTEARKTLARHYLPKRTESTSEHRYFIEIPSKMDPDEWAAKYGPGSNKTLPREAVDISALPKAEQVEANEQD